MARFYKTSRPQFIDHIYQPDQQLQLAVAQAEIEQDALAKSLASNSQLGIKDTFKAWEGDMNSEVSSLNDEIEPLVQELLTEGTNSKTIRKLNDVKRRAQEAYTSGGIGKMSKEYDNFNQLYAQKLEDAKKIKDDGKRQAELSRLNQYRGYVGKQASNQGYNDFQYSGYSNYVDPTSILQEGLDAETLKSSHQYLKRESAPVIDGKVLTEAERKEAGVKFVGGRYYAPDGVDANGDPSYKDITVQAEDPEWKSYFPFQYEATSITEEGYDTNLISNISQSMLGSNQAVFEMYAQDFRDFENRQYYDPVTKEYVTAKDEYEYATAMIKKKANEYAAQFSGTTTKEEFVHRDDIAGRQAYLKGLSHQYWKKENYGSLITQRIDSSDRLEHTIAGRDARYRLEKEKADYLDPLIGEALTESDIQSVDPVTYNMLKSQGLTVKEAYNMLPEASKQEIRDMAQESIKGNPDSPYYNAIEAMEEKFIDATHHGTGELREVLLTLNDPKDALKQINEGLKSEPVKQSVREAKGDWKFEDGVYIGMKDNGGMAIPYTNEELLGKTYHNEGTVHDGYIIVNVDPEGDLTVSPMDFTKNGSNLTIGSAGTMDVLLMDKKVYEQYIAEFGKAAAEKITISKFNNVVEKNPDYKGKMVKKQVTKFVTDYKHEMIID